MARELEDVLLDEPGIDVDVHVRRLTRWFRAGCGGEFTRVSDLAVTHDAERQRYEIARDGDVVGHIDYRQNGDTLAFVHTEVRPELRGGTIGTQLVAGALQDVRSRGLRVQPVCWFV